MDPENGELRDTNFLTTISFSATNEDKFGVMATLSFLILQKISFRSVE